MTHGALLDPTTSTEMPALLTEASEAFGAGHPRRAMRRLQAGPLAIRRSLPEAAWRRQVDQVFRSHAVAALLRQDPMTRRSCEKPRGYPGDATPRFGWLRRGDWAVSRRVPRGPASAAMG